jgi:hypothetical protein
MDSKTDTTPKAGRLKRAMPSNGRFTKDFVKMVNKQNTYQNVVPHFSSGACVLECSRMFDRGMSFFEGF